MSAEAWGYIDEDGREFDPDGRALVIDENGLTVCRCSDQDAPLIARSPLAVEACRAVVKAWESGDLAAAARLCAAAIEGLE